MDAIRAKKHKNEVRIKIVSNERVIKFNGIPNHATNKFTNSRNPIRISAQVIQYPISGKPEGCCPDHSDGMHVECGYQRSSFPSWSSLVLRGHSRRAYELLSGAIDLGVDATYAYVQLTGESHDHGRPAGLIDWVPVEHGSRSPRIG
jgi:hypothetical protein